MTEADDLLLDEQIDEGEDENSPFAKRMRRQVAAATKRAEKAERALAFRDSGIRLRTEDGDEDPVASLFLKAYDGALDPESIRTEAARYGLATPPPPKPPAYPAGTEEQARNIAAATGEGDPPSTNVINDEVVRGWSQDKRMRFRTEHPAAWARLLAGEQVTGITY